jgi:hypothetical protein
MALWWIEHPAAHAWQGLINAKTHKFPGVLLPLRKSNTNKKLHNYKVIGEYHEEVGSDESDRLLKREGADKYYKLADGLKIIRSTREHRNIRSSDQTKRRQEAFTQSILKEIELNEKIAQEKADSTMIRAPKRRRRESCSTNTVDYRSSDFTCRSCSCDGQQLRGNRNVGRNH